MTRRIPRYERNPNLWYFANPTVFKCSKCGETFKGYSNVRAHKKEAHAY